MPTCKGENTFRIEKKYREAELNRKEPKGYEKTLNHPQYYFGRYPKHKCDREKCNKKPIT